MYILYHIYYYIIYILVINIIYHQLYGYLHYVIFINDYVTDFIVTPDISHFIRELCICRDSWRFFCSNKYRNVSIDRIYLYNIIIMLL